MSFSTRGPFWSSGVIVWMHRRRPCFRSSISGVIADTCGSSETSGVDIRHRYVIGPLSPGVGASGWDRRRRRDARIWPHLRPANALSRDDGGADPHQDCRGDRARLLHRLEGRRLVRSRRRHRFIDPDRHAQNARDPGGAERSSGRGRGRVYSLSPGSEPSLVAAGELPPDRPAVGWLRPATEALLVSAGAVLLPDAELRSFGEAASRLLESASEVAYGSLRLEYMQALGSAFARNRWTRT